MIDLAEWSYRWAVHAALKMTSAPTDAEGQAVLANTFVELATELFPHGLPDTLPMPLEKIEE